MEVDLTLEGSLNDSEIKRVLERKDKIKMVIVPQSSKIKAGDYVLIAKVNIKGKVN